VWFLWDCELWNNKWLALRHGGRISSIGRISFSSTMVTSWIRQVALVCAQLKGARLRYVTTRFPEVFTSTWRHFSAKFCLCRYSALYFIANFTKVCSTHYGAATSQVWNKRVMYFDRNSLILSEICRRFGQAMHPPPWRNYAARCSCLQLLRLCPICVRLLPWSRLGLSDFP